MFLNTSPFDKRVRIVRPTDELKKMPSASTDIFCTNIFDYYKLRPKSMEHLTLSEVAAEFNYKKKPRVSVVSEDDEEDVDEDQEEIFRQIFEEGGVMFDSQQNAGAENDYDEIIDAAIEAFREASDDENNNAPQNIEPDAADNLPADMSVDDADDENNDAPQNIEIDAADNPPEDMSVDDAEQDACPVIFTVRRQPRIIRWKNYNPQQDPENYYRMMLLLFHPWRNEPGEGDLEATFEANRKEIFRVYQKFVPDNNVEELENAHRAEEAEVDEEEEPPNVQVQNQYEILNPPPELANALPVSQAIGLDRQQEQQPQNIAPPPPPPKHTEYKMPNTWNEAEFLTRIARLNKGQRKIFMEVMSRLKKENPFHVFITGGAGVGKSYLIETIYQAALNYFNKLPNAKPDAVAVLLCAPTGKAAFNIRGMTAHHAFSLPVSQSGGKMSALSADISNSLRAIFSQLKLLILDEVSMVGLKMMARIDERLRQLMGVNEPFGGLPVIVLGDFNQLQPVFDA